MSGLDEARRERFARWFHRLALFYALLGVYIIVFGGFRFWFLGIKVSAKHLTNPIAFILLCTVAGRLLAPSLAWGDVATGRFLGGLWRGQQTLRTTRWGRAALVAVLAGVIGTLGVRGWQAYLVDRAAKLEGLGDHLGSAESFRSALRFPVGETRVYRVGLGRSLYRAGRHEEAIEVLLPEIGVTGPQLPRRGYRALWRSLIEAGRYEEAREVVLDAMGAHPAMGRECTGVLLRLNRLATGTSTDLHPVRFVFRSAPGEPGPLYLTGNWNDRGKQDEIDGWHAVPMDRVEAGRWEARVEVEPSIDFPFAALVVDQPSRSGRRPARAMATVWVDGSTEAATGLEVELRPLPQVHHVPVAVERQAHADGRPRVLALWPDGGSWPILNMLVERGLMPNAARLLESGTRFQMRSTSPPFTSTAYVRMVELDPPETIGKNRSPLETLLLQLKGIPFLDGWLPDSLVTEAGEGSRSLFGILAEHRVRAVNLVFNDKYLVATNDLAGDAGDRIELPPDVSAKPKRKGKISADRRDRIVRDILGFAPGSPRAAAVEDHPVFLAGIENTEKKARAGVDVWREFGPDFLLLRFPSVDILSHKYYWSIEEEPGANLMIETYRHLDRTIGLLAGELDADDTLLLVSDHGIQGTLTHHWSSILIVEGPGMPAGEAFGATIPIDHFPCVVLSRFGIEEGAERLAAEERALLFARK